MSWFPGLPDWDALHPVVVMFPVALLLVTPLLLLASLIARGSWRAWAGAALVLMAVGTLAAWYAVGTGHAAGQLVDKTPGLDRLVAGHEALGLLTRNLFTVLTLLFGAFLALPALLHRPLPAAARVGGLALVLVLHVAATSVLTRAADLGGRLVHVAGVHAVVATGR